MLGLAVSCSGESTPPPPPVPAAPSGLVATAVSSARIDLTWTDNATDEDGVFIERCSGAGCTNFSTAINITAPGYTAFSNTGLTAGTSYSYRVMAYSDAGSSSPSNTATAVTLEAVAPPAAPTGLSAIANSSSQISLAWTDVATNEDGYYVERCSGAGCSTFSQIGTLAAGAASYVDIGLTASTSYSYRVRAYNGGGMSAFAGPVTTATPSPVAPPAAPTGLTATPTSGTAIALSWTDVATTESNYEVQRCAGAACSSFATLVTLSANATGYTNTGLATGTSYSYRVRATNSGGNSGFAGPVSATPPAAPAAPSGLTTNPVSTTQINLSWTDNATNETGFQLERCTGSTCTVYSSLATLAANTTTYQHTGLAAGTTYKYRVRAINVGGTSAYATATGTTQTPSTLPAAPTNLVATATSSSQINLTWTDNATNETGFRVEICDGSGCTDFVDIGTLAANLTAGSITGLSPATLYRVRIRATNGSGNSNYSNTASATTQASAPLKIRVVNNALSTLSLHDIVRLKLEPNVNSFSDEDLLSDDRLTSCMDIADVNYISNGTAQTFDQNIGPNYSVWIQVGVWQTDYFGCSTIPWVWTRLTSFNTGTGLRYAYVIANITNHTSGTVDFVVTGSYLNGTMRLSMQQNGVEFANIPFIVTP